MKYIVIDTFEDLKATCNYFRTKKKPIGFDLETEELNPFFGKLRLAQLSDGSKTIILDVQNFLKNEGRIDDLKNRAANFDLFLPLKELLEDKEIVKVIHYSQFECLWMRVYCDADPENLFDTYLASINVNYNLGSHGLASVAREYLSIDLDKTEQKSNWKTEILSKEQFDYAALDVFYLPKLFEELDQRITDDKLERARILDVESVPATVDMKIAGLMVEPELYKKEIKNLTELRKIASDSLQAKLRITKPNMGIQQSMFGIEETNYSDVLLTSPSQVLTALKELGLPVVASTEIDKISWYKKKGLPFAIGTGKTALEGMMGSYPVIKQLLDFRGVEKMLTAFGNNFLEHLVQDENGDWRVYADFRIIGAPTGRFSCSNPNVQQIPDKKLSIGTDEYDLAFRDAFIFPEGRIGINADYSQIELRILAEFSKCPIFMEAFIKNKDLHALTAAALFNAEYEFCKDENHPYYKKYRKPTKNVNFGIAYGIGPQRLAAQLHISVEEATEILNKHKNAHPVLWEYLDNAYLRATRTLQARTASGRLQKFQRPNLDENGMPNKGEVSAIGRNGKNMPIQGCLANSARIYIQGKGYQKIGEAEKAYKEIWDGENLVNGIIATSGLKQLTKVKFEGGNSIECSPEHKFWAIKKGGEFEWVEARNLTRSHKVLMTNKIPNFDFLPKRTFSILNEKNLNSKAIGILAAVNHLFGKVYKNKLDIILPESQYKLKSLLRDIFHELGLTFYEESVYDSKNKIKTRFSFESESLVNDLKQLDCTEGFPEVFWSSKVLIENFLKVLFNFSLIKNEVINYGKKNESYKFLLDIQQALYLFGVNSNILRGLRKNTLFISKRDTYRFILNVGMVDNTKAILAVDYHKLKNFRVPNHYNQIKLKVQSVEVTKNFVEMYDVIDSVSSCFMANGLITHNTSADILKRALKLLHDALKIYRKKASIVNIVHDEITVECDEDIAEEVRQILERCMKEAAEEFIFNVPIKVDAKLIKNWGDK